MTLIKILNCAYKRVKEDNKVEVYMPEAVELIIESEYITLTTE